MLKIDAMDWRWRRACNEKSGFERTGGAQFALTHRGLRCRASAAAAAVLTAPEGWQNILFSTLGKKWVQVTYMDPLYAS